MGVRHRQRPRSSLAGRLRPGQCPRRHARRRARRLGVPARHGPSRPEHDARRVERRRRLVPERHQRRRARRAHRRCAGADRPDVRLSREAARPERAHARRSGRPARSASRSTKSSARSKRRPRRAMHSSEAGATERSKVSPSVVSGVLRGRGRAGCLVCSRHVAHRQGVSVRIDRQRCARGAQQGARRLEDAVQQDLHLSGRRHRVDEDHLPGGHRQVVRCQLRRPPAASAARSSRCTAWVRRPGRPGWGALRLRRPRDDQDPGAVARGFLALDGDRQGGGPGQEAALTRYGSVQVGCCPTISSSARTALTRNVNRTKCACRVVSRIILSLP